MSTRPVETITAAMISTLNNDTLAELHERWSREAGKLARESVMLQSLASKARKELKRRKRNEADPLP